MAEPRDTLDPLDTGLTQIYTGEMWLVINTSTHEVVGYTPHVLIAKAAAYDKNIEKGGEVYGNLYKAFQVDPL